MHSLTVIYWQNLLRQNIYVWSPILICLFIVWIFNFSPINLFIDHSSWVYLNQVLHHSIFFFLTNLKRGQRLLSKIPAIYCCSFRKNCRIPHPLFWWQILNTDRLSMRDVISLGFWMDGWNKQLQTLLLASKN